MRKLLTIPIALSVLGQLVACRTGAERVGTLSHEDAVLRDRLAGCDLNTMLSADTPPLLYFPPDQQSGTPSPKDRNVAIMNIPQKGDVATDGPKFFVFHPAGDSLFWIGKSKGMVGGTDWFGPATFGDRGLIITVGAPSCPKAPH